MPSPGVELHFHNLRPIKLLGTGATGTVFLVHNLISGPYVASCSPFALKVVEKSTHSSTLNRANSEMSILNRLSHSPHPFLPYLIGSFETHEFIAWAIPFCPGRDLNLLRYRQPDNVFSVNTIRFYLAEIVCALQHLHSLQIVYRDLKPENILIQESGHVTLTDFDLSKTLSSSSSVKITVQKQAQQQPCNVVSRTPGLKKQKTARVLPVTRGERSNSFVGTEEYLSPEMVRGDGHEFGVDWWALGILAYEMLYGTTPFKGKNKKDTYGRILTMQPKFNGSLTTLTDLVSKLLVKEPTRRLGYRTGACEIKEHPFFYGLKWDMLNEVVRPPFIPSKDNFELTGNGVGFSIKEHFRKVKEPPALPLDSLSCNVSLTEF